MNRRIISVILVVILVFGFTFSVNAVTPRIITIDPGIRFDGTTAYCTVNVCANNMSDSIFVTAKLFDEDGNAVKTWAQSGSGFVNLSRSIEVISGVEYTLKAYVVVNNESNPTLSVSATCP